MGDSVCIHTLFEGVEAKPEAERRRGRAERSRERQKRRGLSQQDSGTQYRMPKHRTQAGTLGRVKVGLKDGSPLR